MTTNAPNTRFDEAVTELRRLGITLRSLPGEYSVNFRQADPQSARMAETLAEAVALGRLMAAQSSAAATAPPRCRRRKRVIWLTAKQRRRRFIRQHNRRRRTRALRQLKRKKKL